MPRRDPPHRMRRNPAQKTPPPAPEKTTWLDQIPYTRQQIGTGLLAVILILVLGWTFFSDDTPKPKTKRPVAVAAIPMIESFEPESAPPGTEIRVQGSLLDQVTSILFGGQPALRMNLEKDVMRVIVPMGARSGQLTLQYAGGSSASQKPFRVEPLDPPTITNLNPESGTPFMQVEIQGKNLKGISGVFFGQTPAMFYYIYPNGERMVATVPSYANTGPIRLISQDTTVHSDQIFRVIPNADPDADFFQRDELPQSLTPQAQWCYDSSDERCPSKDCFNEGRGPKARTYPAPPTVQGVDLPAWKRARVLATVLRNLYLPYGKHHIPAFDSRNCEQQPESLRSSPGMDGPNLVAWIYNYALGLKLPDDLNAMSDPGLDLRAGRKLADPLKATGEALFLGDLLFFSGEKSLSLDSVAIFLDEGHIAETRLGGQLEIRPFDDALKARLLHARRPIE